MRTKINLFLFEHFLLRFEHLFQFPRLLGQLDSLSYKTQFLCFVLLVTINLCVDFGRIVNFRSKAMLFVCRRIVRIACFVYDHVRVNWR
jgi:hypothetical protein